MCTHTIFEEIFSKKPIFLDFHQFLSSSVRQNGVLEFTICQITSQDLSQIFLYFCMPEYTGKLFVFFGNTDGNSINEPQVIFQADDFVAKRFALAIIPNDGKQTPMKEHLVFIAQHATGCCCLFIILSHL